MSHLEHSPLLNGPPVDRRGGQGGDNNTTGTGSESTGVPEAIYASQSGATSPDLDVLPCPSATQLWSMAPVLGLGVAIMSADAAVEFASYFQIGTSFKELNHVAWLTISYIITVTVMQPLYSRISDIYGRKPILLFSYAAFSIGIILCTLSFNFWILVLARGIVGIGSGGMGYMVTIILNDIIPLRQRALWQTGLQASSLIGQSIGGILGSLVLERLGWRMVFLLEVPLGPILLILGVIILQLPKLKNQSFCDLLDYRKHLHNGHFDVSGLVTLILALTTFLLALNLGGSDLPWIHPVIWCLFVTSALLLYLFVWIELKTARVPLVPVRLLVTTKILSIMGTVFFANAFLAALLYTIPYYVNVSGRGSASLGGTMNTLLYVGQTVGQGLAGLAIDWTGRPWDILIYAATIAVLSAFWINIRWTNSEILAENVIPILFSGAAIGAVMGALLVNLLKCTKHDDRAILYGMFHIFSSVASMISISSVATIIQNQFGKHLRASLSFEFRDDIDRLVTECMEGLDCLNPFSEYIQDQIRGSFVHAMRDSFNLLCVMATALVMTSLFVNKYKIGAHER